MNEYIIRPATVNDISFLVRTIIEAEKSETDILSYSTVFGLSNKYIRKYLKDILNEEIDGCELSVSSFYVVDLDGKVVAALSAWIEGVEGISSALIKGNLLNYVLPKKCIDRAIDLNNMIRELHVDYIPMTIQIGACYVAKEYRGCGLIGSIIKFAINSLRNKYPDLSSVWVQVFNCNIPSLKAFKKNGFAEVDSKESLSKEIINYLPSSKKYILKKELKKQINGKIRTSRKTN